MNLELNTSAFYDDSGYGDGSIILFYFIQLLFLDPKGCCIFEDKCRRENFEG
jgi:hypothetical protein